MAAKPRSRKRQPVDPHRALRDHVRELLRGGHAHLVFKDAIADWPTALRGAKPAGQPFTPWRLLFRNLIDSLPTRSRRLPHGRQAAFPEATTGSLLERVGKE